jgi:hypothetical protein
VDQYIDLVLQGIIILQGFAITLKDACSDDLQQLKRLGVVFASLVVVLLFGFPTAFVWVWAYPRTVSVILVLSVGTQATGAGIGTPRAERGAPDPARLQAWREYERDERRKEQHCRLCPGCQRVVERVEGCSAMVCGQNYHGGDTQMGCGRRFDFGEAGAYQADLSSHPLYRLVRNYV